MSFCLRIWCVGVGIHLSSFSIAVSIGTFRHVLIPTSTFVGRRAVHFRMRGTLGRFRNWIQQNGIALKKRIPPKPTREDVFGAASGLSH